MKKVNQKFLRSQGLTERTQSKMLGVRSVFSLIHSFHSQVQQRNQSKELTAQRNLLAWLTVPVSSAPFAVFRVLFGFALVFSSIRFIILGWIDDQYISPVFHFSYYGFSWVKPLPPIMLYGLYGLMTLAALLILIGFYYRIATVCFFILFNYFELLDKAYYLNHYYFVSLTVFLLIVIPTHSRLSIDCYLKPERYRVRLPRWNLILLQLQIGCVYFFAGIAKMNADWLFDALPLRIWLPAHNDLPLVGSIFSYVETAFVFSWAGMLFDTLIVFFLLWKRTQFFAYATVVLFHSITGLLFPIGLFPLVMIFSTPLFFHHQFHDRLVFWIESKNFFIYTSKSINHPLQQGFSVIHQFFFFSYITLQILIPLRSFLYSGNLYWTENGYRFSWRVMLMEKSGEATFYVKDSTTGREGMVINREFLNATQEKQMSFQPDMILEFAHFLHNHYSQKGMKNPEVRAEVYVTLNGRPSQLFIDSTRNLALETENFFEKKWVLPYPY
ncbi:MAG: HTTM domain-containing protein [Chloroherpetonaceae bacterium]|nr:HTTM domain-containing protein [Chloroherpetonaceae bacterium]